MRKLILIKHAPPQIVQDKPPAEWGLTEEGRTRARRLAARLRELEIHRVITSEETKAIETGRILADTLALPVETAEGLQEHDRSNVPIMPTREFISHIALFFQKRDERVLGRETAAEAEARFAAAIESLVTRHPGESLAVVTHGTVLSLFLAKIGIGDGFLLWRQLGLPSFLVLSLPEMNLLQRVDSIT